MPSTRPILSTCLAAAAAIVLSACVVDEVRELRQRVVAEAGAEVMPFDLEATTHIFTDTDRGGVQDVVADDPGDAANIEAIRRHLADEAIKFRSGDFSDPEAIHGPDMTGLSTLNKIFDEITIDLVDKQNGATITYTETDTDDI